MIDLMNSCHASDAWHENLGMACELLNSHSDMPYAMDVMKNLHYAMPF